VTARRIAFINEKGGTCKTTLAVNVAAWFAQTKQVRVLLVDLDTQGHAGKSLGVDVRELELTAFDWLTRDDVPLDRVVVPTAVPNLSLVPAYKSMADFPLVSSGRPGRDHLLKEKLKQADAAGYGVVVIDSPPSLGLTTTNILMASEEVVIPVATTYLSLDGCAEMTESVRRACEEQGNQDLRISLVVPTLYRKTQLADEVLAKLASYFPGKLARQPLALNVAIDEAQSHGKTIWEYAPWSRGATLMQQIAEDVDVAGRRSKRY